MILHTIFLDFLALRCGNRAFIASIACSGVSNFLTKDISWTVKSKSFIAMPPLGSFLAYALYASC